MCLLSVLLFTIRVNVYYPCYCLLSVSLFTIRVIVHFPCYCLLSVLSSVCCYPRLPIFFSRSEALVSTRVPRLLTRMVRQTPPRSVPLFYSVLTPVRSALSYYPCVCPYFLPDLVSTRVPRLLTHMRNCPSSRPCFRGEYTHTNFSYLKEMKRVLKPVRSIPKPELQAYFLVEKTRRFFYNTRGQIPGETLSSG